MQLLTPPRTFAPRPPLCRLHIQALSPSIADAANRTRALQRVQRALNAVGDVVPFGSWVSGLHLPGGDLDASLEGELEW